MLMTAGELPRPRRLRQLGRWCAVATLGLCLKDTKCLCKTLHKSVWWGTEPDCAGVERSTKDVVASDGTISSGLYMSRAAAAPAPAEEAEKVMAEARACEAAGAFSIVLEKVPVGLAGRITAELAIPTIGIGAGVDCDGQVLVVDDMLGLFTDFRPKFVKRYAELGKLADQAIADYAAEVRARTFPAPEHGFADQVKK